MNPSSHPNDFVEKKRVYILAATKQVPQMVKKKVNPSSSPAREGLWRSDSVAFAILKAQCTQHSRGELWERKASCMKGSYTANIGNTKSCSYSRWPVLHLLDHTIQSVVNHFSCQAPMLMFKASRLSYLPADHSKLLHGTVSGTGVDKGTTLPLQTSTAEWPGPKRHEDRLRSSGAPAKTAALLVWVWQIAHTAKNLTRNSTRLMKAQELHNDGQSSCVLGQQFWRVSCLRFRCVCGCFAPSWQHCLYEKPRIES